MYTKPLAEEIAEKIVAQDIRYCVSGLIADISGQYYEELEHILSQPDYRTPAEEAGYSVAIAVPEDMYALVFQGSALPGEGFFLSEADAWQAACEHGEIDPHEIEALEHWLISDWLAEKLEAKGEMIERDFLGLTIWGRTTSGQQISADAVILEIAADLERA